jgi:CRP-like cAMP-binding protein
MSKAKSLPAVIENQLLAALSTKYYNHILPLLEPISFALGDILYQPQALIRYVYFPHRTVISIVNVLQNGSMVEMTLVGSEGMLGTALLSGDDRSPHQAIVQVADSGLRMKTRVFKKELSQQAELRRLVLSYSQALFVQVAQTAACNSLHPIVQRLARWLLMTQDRMRSDTFHLTHGFIATMLGVQRAGVTIAAGSLQKTGIIEYSRGRVTVLRRHDLEAAACECYATIKAETARLLDQYQQK